MWASRLFIMLLGMSLEKRDSNGPKYVEACFQQRVLLRLMMKSIQGWYENDSSEPNDSPKARSPIKSKVKNLNIVNNASPMSVIRRPYVIARDHIDWGFPVLAIVSELSHGGINISSNYGFLLSHYFV